MKIVLKPFLILCLFMYSTNSLGLPDIPHFGSASAMFAEGIVRGIPKQLSYAPRELHSFGVETFVGLPLHLLSEAIDKFCSIAVAENKTTSKIVPDMGNMKFILFTKKKKVYVSLLKPTLLWENPMFNQSLKTVIYVNGWTTNLRTKESPSTIKLAEAFLARKDYNFVVLDVAYYVDTLYTWSAYNTDEIGMHLAHAIYLLNTTYSIENCHIIGHSLGAHISGSAGRTFNKMTGKFLNRITGLDPARPCFNEGENLSGLHRDDADFVDVIHTNCGVLGQKNAVGDADFYPNGKVAIQPGCFRFGCSHGRSWEYFAESVYPGQEANFLAVRCSSLKKVGTKQCNGKKIIMGLNAPTTAKGNYFLITRSKSPYGLK